MKKIVTSTKLLLLSTRNLLIKVRNIKFSGFIGGLIFGAIFSLVVNILTVKIQETVDRQRVLESLEREMTYHSLSANHIYSEFNKIKTLPLDQLYDPQLTMSLTFQTRVWDSTDASKYLLELDPDTASMIETYYDVTVRGINELMMGNYDMYKKIYEPCKPFYEYLTGNKPFNTIDCRQIAEKSIETHAYVVDTVVDTLDEVKKSFHPTKDRLASPFLSFLMGNKSVEILK